MILERRPIHFSFAVCGVCINIASAGNRDDDFGWMGGTGEGERQSKGRSQGWLSSFIPSNAEFAMDGALGLFSPTEERRTEADSFEDDNKKARHLLTKRYR
jgi:hypothetical protein